MGKEWKLLQQRKRSKQLLDDIHDRQSEYLIIHYSCESFYERKEGTSPRITSIAVRNLASGLTHSFSIHQIAELNGLKISEIDGHYDDLERQMLAKYFEFAKTQSGKKWLHWNMRDINYGFPAIEHRFRVLRGEPYLIPENDRIDLARLLISIYGVSYIGHPRLESLMKKNHISAPDFLNGQQEAEAFEQRDYVKLHQSTLRKVDVMGNIVGRAASETLETNSTWWEQNGGYLRAGSEALKEHWLVSSFLIIFGLIGTLFTIFGLSMKPFTSPSEPPVVVPSAR